MSEKKGKRWMKSLIGTCAVIMLMVAVYLVGTGLMKRTDVFVGEYTLSDDGETMTVNVGVSGSVGYIRDVSVKQKEGVLYLTFYSAFGGLNSNLGAKSEFTLSVDSDLTEIAIYRGGGRYEAVLQKRADTRQWEHINSR